MTTTTHPGRTERLAGAFVLVVMFVACVGFWIGIPVGTLYGLSKVTDSASTHLVVGLISIPFLMALSSPILFWLNALYLRVTGVMEQIEADEEEFGWQRRVGGPLEPMLIGSLVVAVLALFVWFFVFAHNPSAQVI